MKRKGSNWTREESIIVFNLYCRTPFGRMHKSNPEIIQVAKSIGRTASAVAMRMVNFASLDPAQKERKIKGLSHASKQDRQVWNEFCHDWGELAFESQRAIWEITGEQRKRSMAEDILRDSETPTETLKPVRVRLVQRFFHDTVLSIYNFTCAVCGLSLPILLNASHIIPWSVDEIRRADPRNGLSLCVLHDRAFDRGLISVNERFEIVLSRKAKVREVSRLFKVGFLDVEGVRIRLPDRFHPDPTAFAYHREQIFLR